MNRFSLDPSAAPSERADWDVIDGMSDEEAETRAAADPDARPRTDEELARALRVTPISAVLGPSQANMEELISFIASAFDDLQKLNKISANLSDVEKTVLSHINIIKRFESASRFGSKVRNLERLARHMRNVGTHVQVRPVSTGWIIWRTGAEAASSRHRTKEEALSKARKLAREQRCDLIVYAADGEFQRRISY